MGRIAGVPIVVTPSWILSVVVIAALGVPVVAQVIPETGTAAAIGVSVLLGVLLGASVLAHELGHCVAARILGMTVVEVRLYLLGGVSELARAPRTPREEAVVAAAGPAVSAVLAGAFWVVVTTMRAGTVGWLLVMLLALANIVVAVFNLLPALPLDGGRVLRAGVWRLWGNRRAGTTAAMIGGYLIALLLFGWAIALLVGSGSGGVLPAGISVAMGLFVAVGAAAERPRRRSGWPAEVTLASLAQPVAQLPTETPVGVALDAAVDRAVILTEADGVARGVLDVPAARVLAQHDPRAPSSLVAQPLTAETIVLADDDPAEAADRARTVDAAFLLLIDDAGRPAGVLRRADIAAVRSRETAAWWRGLRRSASPARAGSSTVTPRHGPTRDGAPRDGPAEESTFREKQA